MGNDKKVYIINAVDYPMEKIKEELHDEGYPYNFHFGKNSKALLEADEVWCFSDCSYEADYITAVNLGKSIWQMG